ncbi:MAG: hypothetical protein JWM57_883 [Phycisphaerales bacterium]|nr:hypothetical protein [Phycisphaerales bacterium]
MADDPLTPLPYQGPPDVLPPISNPFGKFFAGVVFGIVAVVVGVAVTVAADSAVPSVGAAAFEFITGIVLVIRSRDHRPFGIGLIAALPIGLLLFFVGCAFILALNK